MPTIGRWILAAAPLTIALAPGAVSAQTAPSSIASPTPVPAASPGGASDPCTSILALVNRPTVATGSCSFKNGHGDVETGYTNTVTTGSEAGVAVAYPQAFLRAGTLVRNLEIDITPPSIDRASAGGTSVTGITDAAYGAKWEVGYTSRAIGSINAFVTVPTGDRAFTAGGSSYVANLNGSYTLSPVFTVSTTFGFESLAARGSGDSVVRTGVFNPALLLVAAFPGSLQVYGEVSNTSHVGVGLPGRMLYDFGAQKQLGARVVIDVETGFAPIPMNGQKLHYVGFGLTYGDV